MYSSGRPIAFLACLFLTLVGGSSVDSAQPSTFDDRISCEEASFLQTVVRGGGPEHEPQAEASGPATVLRRFKSFGVWFWVVLLLATPLFALLRPEQESGVPRVGQWDMCKFVAMLFVVWSHITTYYMGYENWGRKNHVGHVLGLFHLSAFSFVSGVFCSQYAVREQEGGGRCLIQYGKLKGTLRDLVLGPALWHPLSALYLFADGRVSLSAVVATPLMVAGDYWYLGALFIFQLVTPMLCLARYPLAVATAISVLCNSHGEGKTVSFFVLFVAGWSLSGGGGDAAWRATHRRNLEGLLGTWGARFAAAMTLAALSALYALHFTLEGGLPEPIPTIFLYFEGWKHFPWAQGGWFADAARYGWNLMLTLSFVVVCFALPDCSVLSNIGSRTLYVYIIHAPVLYGEPDMAFFVQSLGLVDGESITAVVSTFVLAFLAMLVLGGPLVKALTHWVLQPQWLVDLLTITTDAGPKAAPPDLREAAAEAART